ncbi:uncharacterized protein LOC101897765 isoform X1 [Musca domestica]|uniref:Uncharacterized protein LOC101897765 isoform X1 n=1 Tax=Musca domestica TaxID=7370 RepID=A0A1I8MI04_MUSDO|nr:uncharacterized protein LOC101897765 isoform X1 [Musca domestica]
MKSSILQVLKLLIVVAVLCRVAKAQQNQVSPKLDLSETEDSNNSTVPVIKGRAEDRNNEKNKAMDDNEKDGVKTGPKIHGVRVTVDTGDGQTSKESKESVEITDLGKNKKRVGIHTDITFEITAGGDPHDNKTSREHDVDEKEDASVPIFKGRGGSNSHKNRKPTDPKSQWNPNFSAERRSYDNSGRGRYPDYQEYYPGNVPVYVGSSDGRGGGSSIYRSSDGWNSYIPRSAYWTTERSNYENYRPNDVSGYRVTPSWKPCYCVMNGNDYRRRRDSSQPHRHHHEVRDEVVVKPTSSLIEIVDGKLEKTFSKK